MFALFLTPASISYLNQFFLALLITGYLVLRFRTRPARADLELLAFFVGATLFSAAFFFETSLLPSERLYAVYLENSILGLLMVALIQFAYDFPIPTGRKTERLTVLALSSLYALWEMGFAIWRYCRLGQGQVEFRPDRIDFVLVVEFLWVIAIFARGASHHWNSPAGRRLAGVFVVPLALAVINLLSNFDLVSTPFYHISMSAGILITFFSFTLNYLAAKPETTPLMVRISGAVLTSVLAVLGITGWLVAPAYAARYNSLLPDQRTLHFTPAPGGGYEISQAPYHFDPDLGQQLDLIDSTATRLSYAEIPFAFPFFGQTYEHLFVSDDGAVSFGEALDYKDLEYRFSTVPVVFGLMMDLDPQAGGGSGVFARRDPDRLLVSYVGMRSFSHLENRVTFQFAFNAGGSFDLTTAGLPAGQQYFVNDRPAASIWATGLKPGGIAKADQPLADFSQPPLSIGPQGAVQDEHRTFRGYLHSFMVPIVWGISAVSLLFLVGLPLTLHFTLTRPLNALLRGVAQINRDRRELNLPVQFNDEIGFLTKSFNSMANELNDLIRSLETRVAQRTADLSAANQQLRKLSTAVEQSPDSILIIDLTGKIEYVNRAFIQGTGYSLKDALGKDLRTLESNLTPPETYTEMWSALSSGKNWRSEMQSHTKKGEVLWENVIFTPIRDENDAVTHYVSVKEDITRRKLAEQERERLVISDPLTALFNRRHFFTEAEKIFERCSHPPYELAALMLDIDHFKKVNDNYGHQTGDFVLREVARRIEQNLRTSDLLARYGGEEFVVLVPRTTAADVNLIAERLVSSIGETPIESGGYAVSVSISLGVAFLNEQIESLDELLSHADQAMYQAKRLGRDRWEPFSREPQSQG